MRVIPTLFALALATPALSIPVPRSLLPRSEPGHETSHETGAAPTTTEAPPAVVNHAAAAAAPTTSGLPTDPAENERMINDLVTFAHGDLSIILNQIKPVANDLSTIVEGMIKGARINWMQTFIPGAQAQHQPPTTTTVTITETHSVTASPSTTSTSTESSTAAAEPTPATTGDEDEGGGETAPPSQEERRSLHSYQKRAEPTCSQIYQSDPGDTCEIIALKFGVSADAVHSANPFLDCNDVWVATSICIPAFTCTQMIETKDGDTCESIGARYQVTATDIQTANVFLNCNSIAPSTQVCIPPSHGHATHQWDGGIGATSNHIGGTGASYDQNAAYGMSHDHNGGYGMSYNHNSGGQYGEHYDAHLGMQYAMMGLGMMNPDSPQHMPPIPVNTDNIAKLKGYIQHMQLLATALERLATGGSPPSNPPPAATTAAPTTETLSASATASSTDTAATATTSTSTDAAAPTPAEGTSEKHLKANTHHAAQAPTVGKTHPWR